ncbi:hypothetical protein GCG21_08030 [Pseudactinotalea sp. HY160]|nr:hypothetical protein [Pseudactinotalea sp. HY160]
MFLSSPLVSPPEGKFFLKSLIALDAGGTSVRAALLAGDGTVRSVAVGGRANPVSSGRKVAFESVLDTVTRATSERTLIDEGLDSITICSAGGSEFLRDGWLAKEFHHAGFTMPVHLRSDILAAYCSGAVELDGYGLVSGTGAAAVRVRAGEIVAVADGMGWLLGDEGSGFQIGQAVARAVVADLDRRGPATALTAALTELLDIEVDPRPGHEGRVRTLLNLSDVLFGWSPIELARLTPLAFEFPHDEAAREIVAGAQERLGTTLTAVLDPHSPGPVVLGGSVLTRQPAMSAPVVEAMTAAGFPADLRTVGDGLVGAAVVALRAAGTDVDDAVHRRLTEGVARFRR